ncbi:MAG: O-succinylbenzoic acid--CoA ligase [Verrucomicrobiales bacterium]|jgi:O-succinylbenzoic acid--CoA ligase
MEIPQDLKFDAAFWDEPENNSALLNPHVAGHAALQKELLCAATDAGLRGHLIFSTSGTTGKPKFACLSRSALLASAAAVNAHLQVTEKDHWLCALPTFHVGGLGIHARAHLQSAQVSTLSGRWNASHLCDKIASCGASLSALVPAQLHDIVANELRCPHSLRAVLIGGGALADSIRRDAQALGWPVLTTFGMTEAASQIATQSLLEIEHQGRAPLAVLPAWRCRIADDNNDNDENILEIQGEALFSGYLQRPSEAEPFIFVQPFTPDGWFTTSDRVQLKHCGQQLLLTPLSRADEIVKILGENVDVASVQAAIDPTSSEIIVAAIPDARDGHKLVAVIVSGARKIDSSTEKKILEYNAHSIPPERLKNIAIMRIVPKTRLGKVAKHQLIRALLHLDNFRIIE